MSNWLIASLLFLLGTTVPIIYIIFTSKNAQIQLFSENYIPNFDNIFNNIDSARRGIVTYADLKIESEKSFQLCDLPIAETVHYMITDIETLVGPDIIKNDKIEQKINILWLHGLGGSGYSVYEKIIKHVESALRIRLFNNRHLIKKSIPKTTINWLLPTSFSRNNTWKDVGQKSSWFNLKNISSIEGHYEKYVTNQEPLAATKLKLTQDVDLAAKKLQEYLSCLNEKVSPDKTIIGGSSQGGAVAWTMAENFKSQSDNTVSGDLTFILQNTWLPEFHHQKKEISDKRDHLNISNKINFNLLYNKFDPIVKSDVVESSIQNSVISINAKRIENKKSKHDVTTQAHLEFIVGGIEKAIFDDQ